MGEQIKAAVASMCVRKSVEEVFEAIIKPEITTNFWFTHSSGELEEGKNCTWTWKMYDLNVPVFTRKIVQNELVLVEWGAGKQKSIMQWEFKPLNTSSTYITVSNYDFQGTEEEVIPQVIDATEGFTMVLAGLKAWLEHGICLNLIKDKFPKELRTN